MTQKIINKSGFTLLEIIVSMIILSIIVALAGMGIVIGIKGYMFTKDNAHMAQKVRLAMTRMNRELKELFDITDASDTYIVFESASGNRKIGLDNNKIKIAEENTPLSGGDALINNVKAGGFNLTYKKKDNQPWVYGADHVGLLTSIHMELILIYSENSAENKQFSATVYPRNTEKE